MSVLQSYRAPDNTLGPLATPERSPDTRGFHIDILTWLGEAVRMKKATLRPRDRGDAERLRQRFGFQDESCPFTGTGT